MWFSDQLTLKLFVGISPVWNSFHGLWSTSTTFLPRFWSISTSSFTGLGPATTIFVSRFRSFTTSTPIFFAGFWTFAMFTITWSWSPIFVSGLRAVSRFWTRFTIFSFTRPRLPSSGSWPRLSSSRPWSFSASFSRTFWVWWRFFFFWRPGKLSNHPLLRNGCPRLQYPSVHPWKKYDLEFRNPVIWWQIRIHWGPAIRTTDTEVDLSVF